MARILRGDIWWADLDPVVGHEQAGRRPIVVISHDVLNNKSGTVIALAITSREPRVGFPLAMPITSVRLPKASWIKLNQVRTLSTERLGKRIGRLSPDELAEVIEGVMELIA
jgi:mRNA interferase MazF